ncbi:MAG: hypothetical protein H0W67_07090 [Gemmatimonadales bacterium]|nr:hypothetical protein [Gemmatimonadales bacterium]
MGSRPHFPAAACILVLASADAAAIGVPIVRESESDSRITSSMLPSACAFLIRSATLSIFARNSSSVAPPVACRCAAPSFACCSASTGFTSRC